MKLFYLTRQFILQRRHQQGNYKNNLVFPFCPNGRGMRQGYPISQFVFHQISPPTVFAMATGTIVSAPIAVSILPISFIVAPLSKMSSNKMILFPLISSGDKYELTYHLTYHWHLLSYYWGLGAPMRPHPPQDGFSVRKCNVLHYLLYLCIIMVTSPLSFQISIPFPLPASSCAGRSPCWHWRSNTRTNAGRCCTRRCPCSPCSHKTAAGLCRGCPFS